MVQIVIKWFKENWYWLAIGILVGYVVYGNYILKGASTTPAIEKVQILDATKKLDEVKKLADKQEASDACTPQQVKMILNDEFLMKQMNLFVMDLNTMRIVDTATATAYATKEKMFGVKRELISGGKQVYLMIYEPVSDLKLNKKEYKGE